MENQTQRQYLAEEVKEEEEHSKAGCVVLARVILDTLDAGRTFWIDDLPEVGGSPDHERRRLRQIDYQYSPRGCIVPVELLVHESPFMFSLDREHGKGENVPTDCRPRHPKDNSIH